MAQILVNVSDGVYARVELAKAKLDLSNICQEAIEKALEVEEVRNQEIPDIDKVIRKLGRQKRELIDEWKQKAFDAGMKAASYLNYTDFIDIETTNIALQSTDELDAEEMLGDSVRWVKDNLDRLQRYSPQLDRQVYLKSWIEGVMAFWMKVKNKI